MTDDKKPGFMDFTTALLASGYVAEVQNTHYNRLVALGMEPERALTLTIGTSTALLENARDITVAATQLITTLPPLADAMFKAVDNPIVRNALGLDER
jgi:hypothetical protein